MSFYHWKSHTVAYLLASRGPHRYPALVLLVPVDPLLDLYPREPWNNLSEPMSFENFVKNLVEELFPIPEPATGNFPPPLRNTQAQYSFFRGYTNENTSEISRYAE